MEKFKSIQEYLLKVKFIELSDFNKLDDMQVVTDYLSSFDPNHELNKISDSDLYIPDSILGMGETLTLFSENNLKLDLYHKFIVTPTKTRSSFSIRHRVYTHEQDPTIKIGLVVIHASQIHLHRILCNESGLEFLMHGMI